MTHKAEYIQCGHVLSAAAGQCLLVVNWSTRLVRGIHFYGCNMNFTAQEGGRLNK